MLLRRTIVISCISLLAAEVLGQQPEPKFLIEKNCEIRLGYGGYPRVDVDLDGLPLAAVGRITLHAYNSCDGEIELGQYVSGCTCIKATLSAQSVPPKGTVDINLDLTTPAKTKSSDQFVRLLIGPNKDEIDRGLQVTIRYKISGLVAFKEGIIVVNAKEGEKNIRFRVPLIIEEPARLQDISYRALNSLENLQIELRSPVSGAYLDCSISANLIGPAGLTGELEIFDKKSGVSDTVLCTLVTKPILSIAPSPLRFRWSETEKYFEGTAFVQLNAHEGVAAKDGLGRLAGEKDAKLYASIANAKCELDTKEVAPRLFRVRLRVTPLSSFEQFVASENPDGVIWIVTLGGRDHTAKSAVLFQR